MNGCGRRNGIGALLADIDERLGGAKRGPPLCAGWRIHRKTVQGPFVLMGLVRELSLLVRRSFPAGTTSGKGAAEDIVVWDVPRQKRPKSFLETANDVRKAHGVVLPGFFGKSKEHEEYECAEERRPAAQLECQGTLTVRTPLHSCELIDTGVVKMGISETDPRVYSGCGQIQI